MKHYKLTDQNRETHGGTKWRVGATVTAKGAGTEPCTDGVVHGYADPVLAILCNPVHSNFLNPRLWQVEGNIIGRDGLKLWCKSQTVIRELPVPEITTEQRVQFAFRCANWAVRVVAVRALRESKCEKEAKLLESLAPIIDRESAAAAYAAARAARAAHAAYAAAYAADAVAYVAYVACAADAAARAARAAACAARAAHFNSRAIEKTLIQFARKVTGKATK